MRICGVDCHLVNLPMRRPHRWTGLTASLGSYVLVCVRSDDGRRGWGEATVLAQWGGDFGRYYGETPATVMHVINDVLWPELVDGDPLDHQLLYAKMEAAVRGYPYAKLAVDAAILDLVGQHAGVPVYELLGGRRRTLVPIAHSIGLMPVAEAVEEARKVVAEGMSTIKLKVGENRERDLALIRAVIDAVGEQAEIAVDANQGWSPVSVAQRMLDELQEFRLRYIEQPVSGLAAMAQLAARTHVPLMVDESIWNAHDMAEVARLQAAPLASLYTTKAGGLHRAMQADAVALANSIATNVNGSDETGIGTLANVHLACAIASLGEACVIPVSGLKGDRPTEVAGATYTDDVLAAPFAYEDGSIRVPTGPGWGIEVDLDKVERYTETRTTVGE